MIPLSSNDVRDLSGSKPLIILHWDADGLVSTSLLIKYLDLKPSLYIPRIGFYKLDYEEILKISGSDSMIVVDFGVKTEDIEYLRDLVDVDIYVLDHHIRRESSKIHIYPYRDSDNMLYPSESIMVTELLGIKPNILTVLGFVGDLFRKALENRYSHILWDEWNRYGFTYGDLKIFVDLIQSNYVFMDRDGLKDAVYKLIQTIDDPYIIMDVKLWRERYIEMYRAINRVLSIDPKSYNGLRFIEVDDKLYLTSYIGRYLAEKYRGEYILIGVPNLMAGYSQIYLRISGKPRRGFTELIEELNKMDVYAGGKDDVLGVFMDFDMYQDILEYIVKWLGYRM